MPGAPTVDLLVRRSQEDPATFRARLPLPPALSQVEGSSDRPIDATLVLKESGSGALLRPQRIPMLVPPRQALSGRRVAESFSVGMNEPLLRSLAQVGRGTYDTIERMNPNPTVVFPGRIELWPFAAALGSLGYLVAILARRVDP